VNVGWLTPRTVAAGCAAIAIFAARSARAGDESGVLESRHHPYASPQNFAFEVRVARYIPDVDSDPSLGGKHPYGDVFGTDPRLEIAVEFDWQALRIPHFGSIGPGISAGYTSIGAMALTNSGAQSGESTNLNIYPFYGVAVLRADVLMRDLKVPIVPYVKGGVGMALWQATNNITGSSENGQGKSGEGKTWGSHIAIGGALALDLFDQTSARNLDTQTGINHTYLFCEYMMSDLHGIGQSHVLYVGTRNIAGGLAFEF
jgi:hypothetical protein